MQAQQLRTVIVTGANKGIGYGIVEALAQREGWRIVMACRNIELGAQSRDEIRGKFNKSEIHVEQLDVTNKASIDSFVASVKDRYGAVDVLINNAGVAAKGDAFDEEVVRWTFATNFYGTIDFTDRILGLVRDEGKIIFVGSMAGKITKLSQALKDRFRDPALSRQKLFGLMEEFIVGVREGNYAERGWTRWGYGISKVGINHFARVFGAQPEVVQRRIQVYALCPGYVDTDMTNHKGHLTIQQGAETPVYLAADLPFQFNPELQGKFFEKSKLSSLE